MRRKSPLNKQISPISVHFPSPKHSNNLLGNLFPIQRLHRAGLQFLKQFNNLERSITEQLCERAEPYNKQGMKNPVESSLEYTTLHYIFILVIVGLLKHRRQDNSHFRDWPPIIIRLFSEWGPNIIATFRGSNHYNAS
jgi:hypothetical protein